MQESIIIPATITEGDDGYLAVPLTEEKFREILVLKLGSYPDDLEGVIFPITMIGLYTVKCGFDISSDEELKVWVIAKKYPDCPVCKSDKVKIVKLMYEERCFESGDGFSDKKEIVDKFYSCLKCGIRFDEVKN